MSDVQEVRILFVGVEPAVLDMIQPVCAGAILMQITTADEFGSQYEQWNDETFDAIVCGSAITDMAGIEMGQVLVNQCPETVKYYATTDQSKYEPRLLIKNGFSSAFAFPVDFPLFKKSIHEKVFAAARKERSFRTVRVLDLGGGDDLGFETFIYFPRNKKHIRYTSATGPIDKEKIEKLQERQMGQLYVDHRDMNKFYQYSAKKLRELGGSGVSSTESQEKLRESVRTLFNDIFDQSVKADFDQGREVIKQCESIISNYITKGASGGWYKKLMGAIGESGDTYNHASNVSTFAALFAIGIGHKRPEDLAMAGLFHDIGLAYLPAELQSKSTDQLTDPKDIEAYYSHPERSVTMVKAKRIILPEAVEKAILQHHESYTGKGFPKQMAPNRISQDAQILSFADQFDYLTREEEGKTRLTPADAVEVIRKNGSIGPELFGQLRKLFDEKPEADATPKSA